MKNNLKPNFNRSAAVFSDPAAARENNWRVGIDPVLPLMLRTRPRSV